MTQGLIGYLALACLGAAPPTDSLLRGHLTIREGTTRAAELCFAPDGKRIATAHEISGKGERWSWELRVRDTLTGKILARSSVEMDRPRMNGTALAFSPDGKTIAALEAGWSPVLYDDALEQRRPVPAREDSMFRWLAFSSDGKTLAACDSNEAQTWRGPKWVPATRRRWESYGSHTTFSPDLRLLAVSNHQDVDLWDFEKGKIVRSFLDHRGSANYLAFSPDGRTLAVSASRWVRDRSAGEIRQWDIKTGRLRRVIDLGLCFPRMVAFSPDGKVLAASGVDTLEGAGWLRLYDTVTGKELDSRRLSRDESAIRLVFAPAGGYLGTISAAGDVRLWKVSPAQTIENERSSANPLHPSPRRRFNALSTRRALAAGRAAAARHRLRCRAFAPRLRAGSRALRCARRLRSRATAMVSAAIGDDRPAYRSVRRPCPAFERLGMARRPAAGGRHPDQVARPVHARLRPARHRPAGDARCKAAHALYVPGLLVHLALLSYRYLFVLGDELARLRVALRTRGFRNRADLHSWRTVGAASGTLLVRGHDRGRARRRRHALPGLRRPVPLADATSATPMR